jgi:hypothetical protein
MPSFGQNYGQASGTDNFERFVFFVLIPASTLAICCLIALLLS